MARNGAVADAVQPAQVLGEVAPPPRWRLAGTRGASAAVGEVVEIKDGRACWRLHPAYAAWFWPLMLKATSLALLVPEALLEPADADDIVAAPRAPTEEEKSAILAVPESAAVAVQVHTLVLKGRQPSVHKAFPTRTVDLNTLRYCRARIGADVVQA